MTLLYKTMDNYFYKNDNLTNKLSINTDPSFCHDSPSHSPFKLQKHNNIRSPTKHITPMKHIFIDDDVNSISDLINIANKYKLDHNTQYNIDLKTLIDIKPSLQKLDNMIGLHSLKKHITEQIIYFMQGFFKDNHNDYLHTVLYGNPGTGKTEVAKIIGEIFQKSNILKKSTFKKVTRNDLVAGYLGQTAIKTKNVIQESIGGVLFIDEVYSLGNTEQRDSFSKECIDTLCESLSNHKNELMVIVAGYKDEVKNCFFKYNIGLESRFSWQFHIDDYSPDELFSIFKKQVHDINWQLDPNISSKFFHDNKKLFAHFGRDIETFFSKVKIAHSKRVFKLDHSFKKIINDHDIKSGLDSFLDMENIKNRNDYDPSLESLYV